MPSPAYDELTDAPAYHELSDAPAFDELSDAPTASRALPAELPTDPNDPALSTFGRAPNLSNEEWDQLRAQSEAKDQTSTPQPSLVETLKQGYAAGMESAGASPLGLPAQGAGLLAKALITTPEEVRGLARGDARQQSEALGLTPPEAAPFAGAPSGRSSLSPVSTLEKTPEPKIPEGLALQTALGNELLGSVKELAAPENVAILAATGGAGALGQVGAIAQKLISGGFAIQSLKGLNDSIAALRKAITPEDKAKAWNGIITSSAIAVPTTMHSVGGLVSALRSAPKIPPEIQPLIDQARESGLHRAVQAAEEVSVNKPPIIEPSTTGEINARSIANAEGSVEREIRPPVGEGAPLRQPGETPEVQASPEVPQAQETRPLIDQLRALNATEEGRAMGRTLKTPEGIAALEAGVKELNDEFRAGKENTLARNAAREALRTAKGEEGTILGELEAATAVQAEHEIGPRIAALPEVERTLTLAEMDKRYAELRAQVADLNKKANALTDEPGVNFDHPEVGKLLEQAKALDKQGNVIKSAADVARGKAKPGEFNAPKTPPAEPIAGRDAMATAPVLPQVEGDLVASGALGVEGLSPAGAGQPLGSGGSPLSQLTSTLKTQKPSPNASIATRVADAVKTAAGQWAKGKDAVTAGLGRLKAVSTALTDSYRNLPKWNSFEDAVGKWSGADNASGVEVRDFQKTINRIVPSKLRQEAITNWIQADGDPVVLRDRAAASKPDARAGYEEALKLTPDEQIFARNIQQYLESRLQEGIDTGLLKNGVDNYVTQVWKKENPVTQKLQSDLFGSGNLNPNFKYARQRVFDSYFEGEQAGFKPQNKQIGALIAHYDAAFNKSLASRSFIKSLSEGSTPGGEPIVAISGKTIPVPKGADVPEAFLIKPRANDAVTKDGRPYRPVDHWALRDWKWSTQGPDGQPVLVQGDLLVHPDYVGRLKNMLGRSALTSSEGIATYTTKPALQLGALAKQTKLSLSGFHLTQEGVHALSHRVNPANLLELDMNAPEQRGLVDHGLQVADPRAAELFGEGLAGGGLVGKIPGLGKLQVGFNDWLFKDYIPRLKMTMALDALERNRARYAKELDSGKITDDQVQALTSRQANAAFGELNYRMMGRNPTVQDFLRLTTLAPDFLEARSRFVGQALKPYGREQQVALGLMGATLYVTGRILNQVLDDDPHGDKPFAVYHNGREYRLRTVLGDVQHLVTDPRRFFFNRMSAFSRAATEAATGKDDRGMNRNFWEQAKDAARWFIPISVDVRSDSTPAQTSASSLGVSSRPYTARTELYDLVDKWKKNNPDPRIQEQYEQSRQETRPESAYKKLRDYVRKNDDSAALEEYRRLLLTHTPQQIQAALKPKPFTGSAAADRLFYQSLTPKEQKLYDKARDEQEREAETLGAIIP